MDADPGTPIRDAIPAGATQRSAVVIARIGAADARVTGIAAARRPTVRRGS
jgi:hypothetical protein